MSNVVSEQEFLPYPFDAGEFCTGESFTSCVPVKGDGKAMCFITDLLDEAKRFGFLVNVERDGIFGKINFF